MILDERALAAALGAIEVAVPVDLASRARAGGRRRLMRRRAYAAAGVAAFGVAATPTAFAVRSALSSDGDAQLPIASSPTTATVTDLYATPPASGSVCNGGDSVKVSPSAHPDLLLLPPSSVPLRYAFVRDQSWGCVSPHVALTALQSAGGDAIGAGLVVEGPNAPTPAEDGREGPYIHFFGQTAHDSIDGQPATEFTVAQGSHTDAYWTEPDGGQWHAIVRGMSQQGAVTLLNQLAVDGRNGTARLAGADSPEWTVEPTVPDVAADQTGVVMAQWVDSEGHVVDLTVTQTPDRTYQRAIADEGPESVVTVRGHTAVLGSGDGGVPLGVVWQEAQDVQVQLAVTGGSVAELERIAASLAPASPDDPRFALAGG
jgi:hypothetical protein